MSMGFTVSGCGGRVAGYRLRVAGSLCDVAHHFWLFPLRYREETSIIILDFRTNGKS
jgi:hypothetical protein